MPRLSLAAPALLALAVLGACSRPPAVPDKDKPVEPQAGMERHDRMRRAIDAPLQKARDVQAVVDAGRRNEDAAIDAASDGATATP